ncbi:hypothetical protein HPP92_021978 [Vanilla planifolia]|uniref:Uncharacterized protein n=1 Tax=Vanilla planifolia TaxID=51239 RepID=A0A835UJI3_VANPL|nr:hypothetical protein HPP92_021978 [Vanilla planifolia]
MQHSLNGGTAFVADPSYYSGGIARNELDLTSGTFGEGISAAERIREGESNPGGQGLRIRERPEIERCCRFYHDPATGEITLDGADIRKLRLKWLRAQMTVVGRDSCATTGGENLLRETQPRGGVVAIPVARRLAVNAAFKF